MASADELRVRPATPADAGEVLTLQLAAFVSEAQLYRDALIPPLCDDLASVAQAIDDPACTLLVAEAGAGSSRGRAGRLLGSARLVHGPVARIGRLAVAPDAQGTGVGSRLLVALHEVASDDERVTTLELFTGAESVRNLAFYARHGYVEHDVLTVAGGVRLQVLRRADDVRADFGARPDPATYAGHRATGEGAAWSGASSASRTSTASPARSRGSAG